MMFPSLRRAFAVLALASGAPLAHAAACDAVLPDTMQAVRLHDYGGADQLALETVARPAPRAGEVLLRVRYASVNPIDWKLREGLVRDWWPLAFPAIPGRDVSGEVVAIGEGVDGLACGDVVAGFLGRAPDTAAGRGGYAQFVALDARDAVPRPATLDDAQAAAFPLVAVTAWAAVVDAGRVQAGERVLVHGGAGGVGSLAVQIAKARGAHVITTASARNHDFVRSLGADEAIDYRQVKFEDVVKDVDLVVDTVGGDTLARSPRVLRDGGRLVSIAGMPPADCGRRIACPPDAGGAEADRRALREVAAMFAQGTLRIHVDARFPLAEAGAAQEKNREGHTRGKIVLEVSP